MQTGRTPAISFVKTLNNYGFVTHLKTQLRDIEGLTYVFDYDITYFPGKALFKKSTKAFYWELDNPPPQDPNGPPIPPEPGAPRHPVEFVEKRETRDFEVFFDSKTGYAKEVKYANSVNPEVRLTYDKSGNLTAVGPYIVTTDRKGNILSMLQPEPAEPYYAGQQLGVTFEYSDLGNAKQTNQYYETPFIFINPMYSVLEVLNWGPFQPGAERTGYRLLWYIYDPELVGEYGAPSPWVVAEYTNHEYDPSGKLVNYQFYGDLSRDLPGIDNNETAQLARSIEWRCNDRK